jgi:hypothetical protein
VIVRAGGAIVKLRGFVDTPPAESVSRAVKEKVPEVSGVPEITPAELRATPPGKLPDSVDQV